MKALLYFLQKQYPNLNFCLMGYSIRCINDKLKQTIDICDKDAKFVRWKDMDTYDGPPKWKTLTFKRTDAILTKWNKLRNFE